MKKFLMFCMLGVMLFSICGCNKQVDVIDTESNHFKQLTDDAVNAIEDNNDLSEIKMEVENIKKEIIDTVSNSSDEEKSQYDVKQIAVFMLEKAIEEYETAKNDNNESKMDEAKSNIEMAAKIWSSSNEN